MIGISAQADTPQTKTGLRPVNLQTDLAALADLIELVFADKMDASGRAAIQEMRTLSKMGIGLNLLGRLNDMTLGLSLGFVWLEAGRIVGNASVYPANWPQGMGSAWMIANVAVHPAYRGRGIARRLMQASLDMVRERGDHAILQVDYDNTPAITLYDSLGFIRERPFTTWWRSALTASPMQTSDFFITRRKESEWRDEYELAQWVRPNEKGGIGWLKPLHPQDFKPSLWKTLKNLVGFSGQERLVIHDDSGTLAASLWLETGFTLSRSRLTLLAEPHQHDTYSRALLTNALRRSSASLVIEHPHDDEAANTLLRELRFIPDRTVWHMRWDAE